MPDRPIIYSVRDLTNPPPIPDAQRKADARRAKGWKHTADFMNQLANTTITLGFIAPLATWAFGVRDNPLSTGPHAAIIAVLWLVAGLVLHIVASAIVRSFDL